MLAFPFKRLVKYQSQVWRPTIHDGQSGNKIQKLNVNDPVCAARHMADPHRRVLHWRRQKANGRGGEEVRVSTCAMQTNKQGPGDSQRWQEGTATTWQSLSFNKTSIIKTKSFRVHFFSFEWQNLKLNFSLRQFQSSTRYFSALRKNQLSSFIVCPLNWTSTSYQVLFCP